jgi:hypothetical protein
MDSSLPLSSRLHGCIVEGSETGLAQRKLFVHLRVEAIAEMELEGVS